MVRDVVRSKPVSSEHFHILLLLSWDYAGIFGWTACSELTIVPCLA